MKNKRLYIAFFLLIMPGFVQANAKEKEISKDKIPKAVIDAFEKANPNVKALEYEEEPVDGVLAYEIEFEKNGLEYEFLYSVDGRLLQIQKEIHAKDLPALIVKKIRKEHRKAQIKKVEEVMAPDRTVTGYEVGIKEAKRIFELDFDTKGNFVSTEKLNFLSMKECVTSSLTIC